MEVPVETWCWTTVGMVRGRHIPDAVQYVTVKDVERLLEEADLRRLEWAREHWGGAMPPMKR